MTITIDPQTVKFSAATYRAFPAGKAFECAVFTEREDDGTYSAFVENLPGAGSCGETEEAAIENVAEAVAGLIESYNEHKKPIPWVEDFKRQDTSKFRWIVVHA